jgi:hypothetical protein
VGGGSSCDLPKVSFCVCVSGTSSAFVLVVAMVRLDAPYVKVSTNALPSNVSPASCGVLRGGCLFHSSFVKDAPKEGV